MRQSYEGKEWGKAIAKWVVFTLIAALGGLLIHLVLHAMFHAIGMSRWPSIIMLSKWVSWGFGLYFFVQLAGNTRMKPSVGKASVTTPTGIRVKSGVYNLATRERDIHTIKITKPTHHTLIAGSPGSGKSFSLLEPILMQAMQQGKAGLVYDYKFPALAQLVAATVPDSTKDYYINFDDLSYSHRVNPVHPQVMTEMAYAKQFATTIVKNLAGNGGDSHAFFTSSAIGYFSLILWYLRTEQPQLCTLPHAILLAFQETEHVVQLLERSGDSVIRTAVKPIRTALKSANQLAAIEGTLQQGLQTLISAKVFWVLSGADFSLDLNNPADKKVLVLGNTAKLDEVYGPVLALLATVALKEMNQPGRAESIFLVDEFPTLYIPRFETYPATCRSNGVEVIIGIQDFAQMEDRYGRTMKNAILGTLSNQFFGMQANLESAKYVSELWGKEEVPTTSTSQGESSNRMGSHQGSNASQSVSLTQRQRIQVQDVSNLKQGEFYGKLFQSDYSTFKAQLRAVERPGSPRWQPFTDVTEAKLEANFSRIEREIATLMQGLPPKPLDPLPPAPVPKPTSPPPGGPNQPDPNLADSF
ncbi:type IV secretory system conjugative DNA transfer family protein [Spirosoma gilvum]